MNIALLIVTKDRPDDIQACLESVQSQVTPFSQVIIVDSSESEIPRQRIDQFQVSLPLQYKHSEPGITKQRNIGRSMVDADTDVVLYIDDDVRLSPSTVQKLASFFRQHPTALGVTGAISGEEPHGIFKRMLGRVSFMYTSQVFGFTYGLFNIINTPPDTVQAVQWLPGAFMAYKWAEVQNIEFDEWFTTYGLGEDFDFSYRVSQIGDLFVEPAISVEHNHSNVGRNWHRFGYMRVVNRAYLRKKFFTGKPLYWFGYWKATGAMMIFNAVRGIRSQRYRQEFLGNISGLLAKKAIKL